VTAARRYGIAVASVVIASVIGEGLEQTLAIDRLPSALYLPAVLVATALAGQGPGLLATVLGPLAGEIAVVHSHAPSHELKFELVGLVLYVAAGAGVSVLAGRLSRARTQADTAAAEARRRSEELVAAREAVDRLARDAQRRARDFSTLFEEAPIGIGIAEDVACTRIFPNRTFADMLGVSVNQNISQDSAAVDRVPMAITAPDGTPFAVEDLVLQRAARTGQPVREVEADITRPDGTRMSVVQFAAPLLDDDGRPRGAIGAFLDVTSQRRASEEQRFLAEATRLLNDTLDYQDTLGRLVRLAVPQLADYSLLDVLDPHGEVVRVGLAHRDPTLEARLVKALIDTPKSQGIRDVRGLLPLVRDGRAVLWAHVTPEGLAARGVRQDQIDFLFEIGVASMLFVPLVVRDAVVGAFAWVRHTGRPVFDERDLDLGVEVARRAAAAVENARLYREAQTANRLKDEFVATLSHELRTPLNALLGWTELLKSGQLPPERQQVAIEAIERTAQLQSQITNDLVDVSQAASGAFRLAPRHIAADEVIRSAVEAFRLAAESKGVRLEVQVAPDMPPVFVDPDRLQQIVFNLVANAVKFTPAGTVHVTARVEDGRLEVDVRDTGIGIAPSFLPFVFDRFRQADGSTSRQYGGLGLGLSIVRSLVELHGGGVSAHSDGEGRGATFTVWMPARAPVAAPPATAATIHADSSAL
jgi:signal transduction histidine kinase/PAS domain-containing protein